MQRTSFEARAFNAKILISMLIALFVIFNGSTNTQTTHAAPGEVLILDTTVSGGAASLEATKVSLLGKTPVVVNAATWGGMTTGQFASYDAIVLGDATCGGTAAAAEANVAVWGPAITGNVIINGTDPVYHQGQGGDALTEKGIAFAADEPGETGAYISLSCYYHGTSPFTPVPLLSELSTLGGFTVTGVGCYNDAHIVATHPALVGLTDANLSNWSCSVHEAFDSWPSDFLVLAIAEGIGSWVAPDGTVGTPYIMARGEKLLPIGGCQCPPGLKGCISGQVTDGAGGPLGGKVVRLFSSDCNVKPPFKKLVKKLTARTDSNGCYIFSDLPNGRFDVFMTGRCGNSGGGGSHQFINIINGGKVNDVNFECE